MYGLTIQVKHSLISDCRLASTNILKKGKGFGRGYAYNLEYRNLGSRIMHSGFVDGEICTRHGQRFRLCTAQPLCMDETRRD